MSLMQILDELTKECENMSGKKCNISLILPDDVFDNFTKATTPLERVQLFGTKPTGDVFRIRKVVGNCGVVNLFRASDTCVKES